MKFRRGVLSFTLSLFLPIANENKNRKGDVPPPSPLNFPPKIKCSEMCVEGAV